MVALNPAGPSAWPGPFPDACTHTLFEQQAARTPDAVAVLFEERHLTYRDLDEGADRVAAFLRSRGIAADSLVGVALDRRPELLVALLGVWKAGAAYVPIDPSYPRERIAFMVRDAALPLVLTESKHAGLFGSQQAVVAMDDDAALRASHTLDARLATDPSSLAYVMYTSGSTGQPKGAAITHSGLVNYVWWAIGAYGVEAGGSVPVHSSIAFDLTVTSLFPALLAGGQVELLREDVGAQRLVDALRRRGDRVLVKITPAHLAVLTQLLRPDELAGLARLLVIGGENLPAESLRSWRERAPDTRLVNEYGPTETVVGCCIHEVKAEEPHSGPVPIGRPIANTDLHVLDEGRRAVRPGEMGELYIGGAGVARGYLNRPELTLERFVPDPFSGRAGARLYRTGDLARQRADGVLEFLGRTDDQVKIRGYRIELGEIEAALVRHPDVQSCVVVAREDEPGDRQLVAYVAARSGRRPGAEDVQAFLSKHLPLYMSPSRVVFLDALPLTSNGKVDRKALPAPSTVRAVAAARTDDPRDATEAAIAALWAELLRVDFVGRDADFFDLGGHSLLAIKAVVRMRERLGVDLPPQALFEHSTPAALAKLVAGARGEAPEEPRRGITPLFFGTPPDSLYGVLETPTSRPGTGALLLYPGVHEYLLAHLAFRSLSSSLAARGFPVLRFDYRGTGDSSGSPDATTFGASIDDACVAAGALKASGQVDTVTLVGMRLGAAVALHASKRLPFVRRVVLWDPIVDGREYVQELERLDRAMRLRLLRPLKHPEGELLGHAFPGHVRRSIEAVDLLRWEGGTAMSIAIVVEAPSDADPGERYWSGVAPARALAGALGRAGHSVSFETIDEGRARPAFPDATLLARAAISAVVARVEEGKS